VKSGSRFPDEQQPSVGMSAVKKIQGGSSYLKGKANYDEEPDEGHYSSYSKKPQQSNYRRDQDEQEQEPIPDKEQERKKLLSLYEKAGEQDDPYGGGDEERQECPTCGRKFVAEALIKHQKICKKVFVQKRKVFDVKKVRQEAIMQDVIENGGGPIGGGNDYYKPPIACLVLVKLKQATTAKKAPPQEKPLAGGKVPKWKAQSEMFRAAMRAVKSDDEPSGGGRGFAQPTIEQHDDRTECRHCGRKFNEQAAERHIPLCEKKAREMKNKGSNIKNKTGINFARK